MMQKQTEQRCSDTTGCHWVALEGVDEHGFGRGYVVHSCGKTPVAVHGDACPLACPYRQEGKPYASSDPGSYRVPSIRPGSKDVLTMAVYRYLGALLDAGLPPRQEEALVHVLRKMAKANVNEVGMSRNELSKLSQADVPDGWREVGMTPSGAEKALDGLAAQGKWVSRTKEPKMMMMNKRATERQRQWGKARWWYRLVDEEVPEDEDGLGSLVRSWIEP